MIDKLESHQRRILLLASNCNPNQGSEGAVGWNRAMECAKYFDTCVLTSESQNAVDIAQYLATNGPIPNLRFEFVRSAPWTKRFLRSEAMRWLRYNLWQRNAIREARRLHEKFHFDLIHQVTGITFREPGYAWKLDAPFVWGPMGGLENFPRQFLLEGGVVAAFLEGLRSVINLAQLRWSRRVRRAAGKASALLVANSTGQRNFALFQGIRPELMLETGVSRVTATAHQRRSDTNRLRILWSGQFVPRKALSLLLKALHDLPPDVAFELRVVGGGPMARRWKRLAARLGIEAHVEWLGWIPYKEALRQYTWADVFVFTSLRDTSGNVVLEALANGVPVVCLDHQGAHDIVNERCGIKVPVVHRGQVVRDLCSALTRLAKDADLRAHLSHAALDRARDYLWVKMGERMRDVYCHVWSRHQEVGDGHESPAVTESSTITSKGWADPASSHECAAGSTSSGQFPHTTVESVARPTLNRAARQLAKRAAVSVGCGLDRIVGSRHEQRTGILMYHRLADPVAGVAPPTWNVTPVAFRAQMAGLLERGFRAWSLGQLIEERSHGFSLPARVFVVTFDDGHESVFENAWPILRELSIPSTLFLPTAYVDSERAFPFDDWVAAGSERVPRDTWRPMTTEQCRAIVGDGLVALGAHTHTHQDFRARPDEFAHDLATNVESLQSRFRVRNASFAFPYGRATLRMMSIVRQLGLSCGLTTFETLVDPREEPFGWGRFNVESWDTAATLSAKLNGWYSWPSKLRRRVIAWRQPERI